MLVMLNEKTVFLFYVELSYDDAVFIEKVRQDMGKIAAIRVVRYRLPVGLKEGMQIVDDLEEYFKKKQS